MTNPIEYTEAEGRMWKTIPPYIDIIMLDIKAITLPQNQIIIGQENAYIKIHSLRWANGDEWDAQNGYRPPKYQPKITEELIEKAIASIKYTKISDRETICQMVLSNGYSILGSSACVYAGNYDQILGESYAYKDAIRQCWPLFGFQLASERTGWTTELPS